MFFFSFSFCPFRSANLIWNIRTVFTLYWMKTSFIFCLPVSYLSGVTWTTSSNDNTNNYTNCCHLCIIHVCAFCGNFPCNNNACEGGDWNSVHAVQGRMQLQEQPEEPGHDQVFQPLHGDRRVHRPRRGASLNSINSSAFPSVSPVRRSIHSWFILSVI